MSIELRLPNITGVTSEAQVQQIKSYMYQLVEQLNFALTTLDTSVTDTAVTEASETSDIEQKQKDAQDTFDEIKALIIKSADIVNAYYESMKLRYDSIYTAQSDFGEFRTQATNQIELNSTGITQLVTRTSAIEGDVSGLTETMRNWKGWIRTGELETGVFGIEVGQENAGSFTKYARFLPDGIYFYLPGATEPVAYLENTKLYITNAQVINSMRLGNYAVDLTEGIAFKWAGGGN